jgi:anti-anti-sigma regulatory factor
MKQVIRLKDIYSDDLYTRSRASELRTCINEDKDIVVLDFDQIGFMSRSFADELCNIVDDLKNISFEFVNRNNEIETIMNKVIEGRSQERKRGVSNAKIHRFEDMDSLSEFLLTM